MEPRVCQVKIVLLNAVIVDGDLSCVEVNNQLAIVKVFRQLFHVIQIAHKQVVNVAVIRRLVNGEHHVGLPPSFLWIYYIMGATESQVKGTLSFGPAENLTYV